MSKDNGLYGSPFPRGSASYSPGHAHARSQSAVMLTPKSPVPAGHIRNQTLSPTSTSLNATAGRTLQRSDSSKAVSASSGTFAPQFIKSEVAHRGSLTGAIDGEHDFSGKRYVWMRDAVQAFVRAWVVDDISSTRVTVECDDGSRHTVDLDSLDKVNPAKFDRADDMAELTHLNEASVVHNLHTRYQTDLIYTYSGLFLVTVNPYRSLSIYTDAYIRMYAGRSRDETKPHIFAVADGAFRSLIDNAQNQSILVTGESGAGKTENTKKVIQYLAAVASTEVATPMPTSGQLSNLSRQILQANPILEAFGNAQTVRNNNSSRFGKFIRIGFTPTGRITGAHIDWYLLEKSRVVGISSKERNYHVFYQLLQCSNRALKEEMLVTGLGAKDFVYTQHGNDSIAGISDSAEWDALMDSFRIMGFQEQDQKAVLKTVAAVLVLGNISVVKESIRADQASLTSDGNIHARKACKLLGIDCDLFVKALLHPVVKAGRELVQKAQTPEQVRSSVDALAKGIYERAFGDIVSRINKQLDRTGITSDDSHFIGVLDIAGFEIFEDNSFEQLCINYTNEKLQQFFNHHMFVLEQEEYAREQIEWKFIDFGRDLQPTIDLIELPNPIGIFSCLDEDSVMPKATDKTFTEKLHCLWEKKTSKYRPSRLSQGFILTHYAAEVEYSTQGWLEKNKDPLNDNVTSLLAHSKDGHVAALFKDCAHADDEPMPSRNRVKNGLFRTVAQRHKEQLASLMAQLHSTQPHFVRCILPNHQKRPKSFSAPLVLDQLRCNGVLEGIRIARTGFPNRLVFSEFQQRYEVLCPGIMKAGLHQQGITQVMLEKLDLDRAIYRVGLTKVFFRAGVLADLEEQRDTLIRQIMTNFQAVARAFVQRRIANKRLYRAEATRILQRNVAVYLQLRRNPWWSLFNRIKPMLSATQTASEVKKRDEVIGHLHQQIRSEADHVNRLEEDRRRNEVEIQQVQRTLESERALALDKDEIFKRLQTREAELADKLAEAIDDQENLETQLDEVIEAKQRADAQANTRREKLDQAAAIIQRLEAEKQSLTDRHGAMTQQLAEIEQTNVLRTKDDEALAQENRVLQSQLHLQQRKVVDLENKVLKTDQDLDLKYAAVVKDLTESRRQGMALKDENSQMRKHLAELSSTSTGYEDLMRHKDSEITILKGTIQQHTTDNKALQTEKASILCRHDVLQNRVREVQAEVDATRSHRAQLERQCADAKNILEAKMSEDSQAESNRKMLQSQVEDLKAELFEVHSDLSRERQSRDDVLMLGGHELATLKEEYQHLNESKITIEKELYIQQDTLRRAIEARTTAESARKELQHELKTLRERYTEAETARIEAATITERNAVRQANERHSALTKDLDYKTKALDRAISDQSHMAKEFHSLKTLVADSDNFRLQHDQHKERIERELVTVKGRLVASENDNRTLLNKIQQKNLDIARSNSRMDDSQRTRVTQAQTEKGRLENENKKLQKAQQEAQIAITSLEKQKEKLSLDMEDLQHQLDREHKASRSSARSKSSINAQHAEVARSLDLEKEMRTKAQATNKRLQMMVDDSNEEITRSRHQLTLLHQIFCPDLKEVEPSWDTLALRLPKNNNLAHQLESSNQTLQVTQEKLMRAERQLQDHRARQGAEFDQLEARHSNTKRQMLEELNQNTLPARKSPKAIHKDATAKARSNFTTPDRRHIALDSHDSVRSDRSADSFSSRRREDAANEIEALQNQLQTSELQNRHLQSQLQRSTPSRGSWSDDSPSARRVQKLERENERLNDRLDDSAKKLCHLEKSIRTGDITLRDVQTKSHEELFDLINSQEDARRKILRSHDSTLQDLAHAKTQLDTSKHTKATLEVELRDAKSELRDVNRAQEEETALRSRALQDLSNAQIRLDAESARAEELESSLSLYKHRADEYFSKLEQAEIAVLKATRAEQHAKSQVQDSDETCSSVIAERAQMDTLVEDLQKQAQTNEARIEDLAADLDGALQAKKRLQHELEDYRSQRAMDIEDKESTMEQTRRKYQIEFSNLTNELEIERENVLHARSETIRLRDEMEEMRSKWDDEVLNSSAWAKEKARLDLTLQDLTSTREEAVAAHDDAQGKVVSLLSQVRSLRNNVDDVVAERDALQKDKRGLEHRLAESGERLEELSRADSPSLRNAANFDREILELKSQMAQQQDISSAAISKMRKADAIATELQKDLIAERDNNESLHKEKAALEKSAKALQGRVVDLETKGFPTASQDVRFLNTRVQELETQLEKQEAQHSTSLRSFRNVDRTVKDLQAQLDRRDKAAKQLGDDVSRGRDKIDRLLTTVDELQAEEAKSQLAARRAERDLREEREKALRLERELEGWKSLRTDRHAHASRGSESEWVGGEGLSRMLSTTKGFL